MTIGLQHLIQSVRRARPGDALRARDFNAIVEGVRVALSASGPNVIADRSGIHYRGRPIPDEGTVVSGKITAVNDFGGMGFNANYDAEGYDDPSIKVEDQAPINRVAPTADADWVNAAVDDSCLLYIERATGMTGEDIVRVAVWEELDTNDCAAAAQARTAGGQELASIGIRQDAFLRSVHGAW